MNPNPVNPETVPGSTVIPTWVLIAAILGQYVYNEWKQRGWGARLTELTKSFDGTTATMDKLADGAVALKAEIGALRAEITLLHGKP